MRRHVFGLLVALNVALAALLAAMWVTPQGTPRNVAWQPPAPVKPEFAIAVADGARPDPGSMMASVDRPLFSPSRLPPPVKAAAAAAPVDPLSNIRVQGIYVGKGIGGIIANVDGKSRRIRLNETVGEWTVSSIKDRDVTFTRAGESRVVRLAGSTGAQSGAASAAGTPGVPTAAAGPVPAGGLRGAAQAAAEEQRARLTERLNRGRAR